MSETVKSIDLGDVHYETNPYRGTADDSFDGARWICLVRGTDGYTAADLATYDLLDALAAARAEMENVRRVEAWRLLPRRSVSCDADGWHALELVETDARTVWSSVATADTLAALGAHLEETR